MKMRFLLSIAFLGFFVYANAERSVSAFRHSVDQCLNDTFKRGPINLFFNTDPKAIDALLKEFSKNGSMNGNWTHNSNGNRSDDSNSASSEETGFQRGGRGHMKYKMSPADKERIQKLVKEGNADLKKVLGAKMAWHIAETIDEVLKGLPAERINVGVGYQAHWQYIPGTDPVNESNLTVYHQKLQQLREKLGLGGDFSGKPHQGNSSGNSSGNHGFGGPHRQRSALAQNAALAVIRQALGEKTTLWKENQDSTGFTKKGYQVFFTNIGFTKSMKGSLDLTVDIGGGYSLSAAGGLAKVSTPGNVIVADPPESLKDIIPYLRARICEGTTK